MSSNKSVEALQRHHQQVSQEKQAKVVAAILRFQDQGERITVSAISREAGVSREFIYSHVQLGRALKEAADYVRLRPDALASGASSIFSSELRSDRKVLAGKVERQKEVIEKLTAEVAELERLRQRWLGNQLPGEHSIDPAVHAELRNTSERITAENVKLNRQANDLLRQIAILEGDLTASRRAHAEDAAKWSGANVDAIPIGRSKKSRIADPAD